MCGLFEPTTTEEMVSAGSLAYRAKKAIGVSMCSANRVIAACRKTPYHNLGHVEAPLRLHPVENGSPKAVGAGRIRAESGTIGCAGDV